MQCNEKDSIRSNEITREVEVGKEKNALDQVRVRFSHDFISVFSSIFAQFRISDISNAGVRGPRVQLKNSTKLEFSERDKTDKTNKRQKKLILSTNYGIILTSQ